MKSIYESPEIFEAYARIDFCSYELGRIYDDISNPKSPIDTMVDQATGYIESKKQKAIELLEQIVADKQFIESDCTNDLRFLNELKQSHDTTE